MKKKSVVFFVCMLVIITAFSAVATGSKQEQSSLVKSTGHLGGLFTQLPNDPGYSTNDWHVYPSYKNEGEFCQCYEMFIGITSPIQSIHWWGHSILVGLWQPCDPVGMTFNITFYKDNNSKPGEIVFSYSNVKPSITSTGIIYSEPYVGDFDLYFFEYDLGTSCDLQDGWVSIYNTWCDNGCDFFWMESSTGNSHAFQELNGERFAAPQLVFSLVLTDGVKTFPEIVKITGGHGVTVEINNTGDTTVGNFPVDFIVLGGIGKKIEKNIEVAIGLFPGNSFTITMGVFGLGKITIFVVGDGIAAYKHGVQLFMYTIIQE
jgi:hypothetical protein